MPSSLKGTWLFGVNTILCFPLSVHFHFTYISGSIFWNHIFYPTATHIINNHWWCIHFLWPLPSSHHPISLLLTNSVVAVLKLCHMTSNCHSSAVSIASQLIFCHRHYIQLHWSLHLLLLLLYCNLSAVLPVVFYCIVVSTWPHIFCYGCCIKSRDYLYHLLLQNYDFFLAICHGLAPHCYSFSDAVIGLHLIYCIQISLPLLQLENSSFAATTVLHHVGCFHWIALHCYSSLCFATHSRNWMHMTVYKAIWSW